MNRLLWLVLCLPLVLAGCGPSAPTPTLAAGQPYLGVWYHPARASFLAELMDTSTIARTDALDDMDQNFAAIAALGANTVVVSLPDEDGWEGQFGGGFTYDPTHRPQPQAPVAEELILAAADKNGLRVVFVVGPSGYHVAVDDTFGNSAGAYDFIREVFEPAAFYGRQCTSGLDAIQLEDRCVTSFVNDPRIAGWLLIDETDPSVAPDSTFFKKYWATFYGYAHQPNTWAGVNWAYVPEFGSSMRGKIDDSKRLFQSIGQPPDYVSAEWFASTPSYLSDPGPGIAEMAGWLANDVYASKFMFMSGGSDADPSLPQFYTASLQAIQASGADGAFVWLADAYANLSSCASGTDSDQDPFALFTSAFMPDGCQTYQGPGFIGWHWDNDGVWTLETTVFPAQYGRSLLGASRATGAAVQAIFKSWGKS